MLLSSITVSPELLVKCVHRCIKTSGAPLIVRSLCNEISSCKINQGGICAHKSVELNWRFPLRGRVHFKPSESANEKVLIMNLFLLLNASSKVFFQ